MFLGDPIFLGNNNKEQFLKIVEILGPPSKRDYTSMGYGYKINMPDFQAKGLASVLGPNVDPLAVDLIGKMLTYNRETRIEPFQALAHPYFDELRTGKVMINNRLVVDLFDFKEEEIGQHGSLVEKLVPDWYKKQKN